MEKQLRIVRFAIFGFGAIFFCIGAVIAFQTYSGPSAGKTDADYMQPVIFMALGLMDILIVTVWSIISAAKAKREKWLRENGQLLRAKLVSINKNMMVTVNKNNPYVITCEWKDPATAGIHIFKSKNIWFDPTHFINKSNTIDVYYDPDNMKKYAIDLSFLPAANQDAS
ncbi:MAG: hypothetical protein JWO44_77 [Bacteroidetes bacterium]|nr:hypothetical protein [Bacteroidota bacterium]